MGRDGKHLYRRFDRREVEKPAFLHAPADSNPGLHSNAGFSTSLRSGRNDEAVVGTAISRHSKLFPSKRNHPPCSFVITAIAEKAMAASRQHLTHTLRVSHERPALCSPSSRRYTQPGCR